RLLERAGKWVRRHPLTAGLTAAIVLAVLLGLAGVSWQWQRAERQRVQTVAANIALRLQSAEDHFLNDQAHLALAVLARLLREHSTNRVAAERLVNALNQRTFLLPAAADAISTVPGEPADVSGIGLTTIEWMEGKVAISNAHEQVIRHLQWSPDLTRLI